LILDGYSESSYSATPRFAAARLPWFISRLLPLFAALAFLANALGWFSHRQWLRSLLGMIGPAIVFAATVWLLGNWWTANLMYVGLALMIGVSIWDFVSPAHRRCGPDGCELPAKRL
ncbi:MerC family mercury resistance protein, partial [Escherichia coli]|uniref:MerC family mercury resistance protein n=1 Tax=Escherichia coli TaxID=562 RepID=UPI0021A45101